MFSSSGAGGTGPAVAASPVGGSLSGGRIPDHPHRAAYPQQPPPQHYQYPQGASQGYPAQQGHPQHQRAVSAQQHPGGPPGSSAHGPDGPRPSYGGEQYPQGYRTEAEQGPAGIYAAPSPHMGVRQPSLSGQQQQQQQHGVHQAHHAQQHLLAPGQASYGAHAPPQERSPAPPAHAQPHYSASPTTYATPQPLPSPHPNSQPSPSPHLLAQRIPSTSHPYPPQPTQAYAPPHPSSQPGPSQSRAYQTSSPHPASLPTPPLPAYTQQARRTSHVQNGAPPPAGPPSGPERAHATYSTGRPQAAHASPAVHHAQAQAQAQAYAHAQAQAQAQAHAHAHAQAERGRHARPQVQMPLQMQAEARRSHEATEQDEQDVVGSAAGPLRLMGHGYVPAPGQGPQQQQLQGGQVPQVVPRASVQPLELADDTEQRTQFHAYLLDYLQKAGFVSTAAALLADAPSIPTHPHSSGRSFDLPSSASSSQPRSAVSSSFPLNAQQLPLFNSPPALSPPPLAHGGPSQNEHESPRRHGEGSPVSPLSSQGGDDAYGKNNADTVESTASAASTTSHFGFEALEPGHGDGRAADGASASPAKEGPRSPSKRPAPAAHPLRNVSGSSPNGAASEPRRVPAANVQIDAPTGFLFEWWSVFWDVFRAQAASRRPGAVENGANARSFCQASSAAVDAAMQRQASSMLRAGPAHGHGHVHGHVPNFVGVTAAPPPPQVMRPPPNMQAQHQGPPPALSLTAPPPNAHGGPAGRQPIPLRTTPLPGRQPPHGHPALAQQGPPPGLPPQHQRAPSAQLSSRVTGRRGAIPPDALPDEALPPTGLSTDSRRPSTTSRAAQLALQRREEQQAEINMRMAQAKVHAQQITSRHRTVSGASPGVSSLGAGTPEAMALGTSPAAAQATPPSTAFSPGALNYNPDQLQQAAEARKAYRARLLASQQSQLEKAKGSASGMARRASASAATPAPTSSTSSSAKEGEGSMPPPARTLSLNNTPHTKELALGPSPGVGGATPAGEGGDAPSSSGAGKRRRESLGASVSEARETKKRATRTDDAPGSNEARSTTPAQGVTPKATALPDVKEDIVTAHDFALMPTAASSKPTDAPVSTDDFVVVVESAEEVDSMGVGAFDVKALGLDPSLQPDDESTGQFSLEQLDALLSSTVDAAGSGYPPPDGATGDAASFDYEEFMNSFGNDGPASYDPTAQTFDLAV